MVKKRRKRYTHKRRKPKKAVRRRRRHDDFRELSKVVGFTTKSMVLTTSSLNIMRLMPSIPPIA